MPHCKLDLALAALWSEAMKKMEVAARGALYLGVLILCQAAAPIAPAQTGAAPAEVVGGGSRGHGW